MPAIQEKSIIQQLKEMVKSDSKVYFILWKYAPELLPETFKTYQDLKNNYKVFTKNQDEKLANNWLYEETVQNAVKWLLNRSHQTKLIELYNLYFERAKTDTNAFKAFSDFSERFYSNQSDSSIRTLLSGISDDDLIDGDE